MAIFYLNTEGVKAGRAATLTLTTLFLDEMFFVVFCPILVLSLPNEFLFGGSGNSLFLQGVEAVFWTVYLKHSSLYSPALHRHNMEAATGQSPYNQTVQSEMATPLAAISHIACRQYAVDQREHQAQFSAMVGQRIRRHHIVVVFEIPHRQCSVLGICARVVGNTCVCPPVCGVGASYGQPHARKAQESANGYSPNTTAT